MEEELEAIRREMKRKRMSATKTTEVSNGSDNKYNKVFFRYFSKFLFTIILTLSVMIGLKGNTQFKTMFYRYVYETNFDFAVVNQWYQKTFGSPIPFRNLFQEATKTVFQEQLSYEKMEDYLDGVQLKVTNEYLVPVMESGLVVFIGEKEGYGKTVIVQQMNGVDLWYGNVNGNVAMYDYVEKGSLLGNCLNDQLYLVFQKNGDFLDYHDYI